MIMWQKAMDYKEKYEEAKRLYKTANADQQYVLESLFPQLKESEDERIMKEIAELVMQPTWKTEKEFHRRNELCAWLEKQGEQKPVDKVEPKFKVGDWVVFENKHQSIYQVEKIEDGYYILRHTRGGTFRVCILHDESLRPWTIQDAKDGDVLCSNQIILLFKQWEDNSDCNFVIAYAGIDVSGKLQITDGNWLISNKSKPATKEQRDLLFQKIKEAGYNFNFGTKELKKIESDSTWNEEDEISYNYVLAACTYYGEAKGYTDTETHQKANKWLKALKDRVLLNNTWKPSDE